MNLFKREQLKNKIQFIIDAMTLKGKRKWDNKLLYVAYRDKVCESIIKEFEELEG
jgi:hypothetical protein